MSPQLIPTRIDPMPSRKTLFLLILSALSVSVPDNADAGGLLSRLFGKRCCKTRCCPPPVCVAPSSCCNVRSGCQLFRRHRVRCCQPCPQPCCERPIECEPYCYQTNYGCTGTPEEIEQCMMERGPDCDMCLYCEDCGERCRDGCEMCPHCDYCNDCVDCEGACAECPGCEESASTSEK